MSKSSGTGFGLKAKLSSGLLLFALLFSCAAPCASALAETTEAGKYVEITSATVNVRNGPGTSYGIIGLAYANETYKYLSSRNGWYQIQYKSSTGWVDSNYVILVN